MVAAPGFSFGRIRGILGQFFLFVFDGQPAVARGDDFFLPVFKRQVIDADGGKPSPLIQQADRQRVAQPDILDAGLGQLVPLSDGFLLRIDRFQFQFQPVLDQLYLSFQFVGQIGVFLSHFFEQRVLAGRLASSFLRLTGGFGGGDAALFRECLIHDVGSGLLVGDPAD